MTIPRTAAKGLGLYYRGHEIKWTAQNKLYYGRTPLPAAVEALVKQFAILFYKSTGKGNNLEQ